MRDRWREQTMGTIASYVQRHRAVAYFGLTFAVSWGGTLLAIGSGGGMRGTTPASDPRFAYAVLAMLAGPSVTAIALTAFISGRAGLRALFHRLLVWRVAVGWYLVALLTAPIAMVATLVALSIAFHDYLPGVVASDHRMSLLLVSLAVGLSAGLLEELGWTGFAIPTLRANHGIVATGLIVGVCWSAWHLLPNVWSSRAAAGELSLSMYLAATMIGVFVGYLTAFRLLMVWVYEHTRSLFLAMLMHVSLTASLLILNPLDIAGVRLQMYSFGLAAMVWLVTAIAVAGRRSGHRAGDLEDDSTRPRAPMRRKRSRPVDAM
jgi:membrane protease YdiL (CAAX protease family)